MEERGPAWVAGVRVGLVLSGECADECDGGEAGFLGDLTEHSVREIFVGVRAAGGNLSTGFGNVDVVERQQLWVWCRADDVRGDADPWSAHRGPVSRCPISVT